MIRRHWKVGVVFTLGIVLLIAASIYVFLWFVSNAQSSGLVPSTLGLWTMNNLVAFILNAIFWELVLVGIPIVVAVLVGWQLWWKKLDMTERNYRMGGRKRTTGGGGGSLLLFIVFCIKVYIDGKWNVPIATFTLDYVVGSIILIVVWGLVILGIPAAIGLTWWVRHEMKTTP